MTQTLADYVSRYVQKHGFHHLVEQGLSPEQIRALASGQLPPKEIVPILQDFFFLSSEELLEIIHKSSNN